MKWPFGKNQSVALSIFGTLFLSVYTFVWTGHLEGAAFANFAMWFGPTCLAAILGPSALIKIKQERKDV